MFLAADEKSRRPVENGVDLLLARILLVVLSVGFIVGGQPLDLHPERANAEPVP
jgi:hypothetical protein